MTQPLPIILSGAQPSGDLTLGNYLGALKQWKTVCDTSQAFFCVVDLHALTVRNNPDQLKKSTYDALATYLACGLSPENCTLFLQSHVPEHTQLMWLLQCYVYLGELNRMTQFKEKSGQEGGTSNHNAGLFAYPVLMAADILLYQAEFVPVGEDQTQHLELTRDLAQRLNSSLQQQIFTLPKAINPVHAARVMSLADPLKKMSKSDANRNSCIYLRDSYATIAQKFKSAVTDSERTIYYDREKKPGISNLIDLYCALTDQSIPEACEILKPVSYQSFKQYLTEETYRHLQPIQTAYQKFRSDEVYLDTIFQSGRAKAQAVARKTLEKFHAALGLVPSH